MTYKIEIDESDRDRILDWLNNRGGVAIWSSVSLSHAGQRTLTPADAQQPSWHYAKTPDAIVTDPSQIGVYTKTLFKAFPVSLRRSGNGLMFKLTDPSQRKVDRVMQQCREKHGDAFIERDVMPDKAASIGVFYSGEVKPLCP